MQDFQHLEVWQVAHQLTLRLYSVTRQFPKDELYGLTSQIRRCAVSIAANIAEGCGWQTDADFKRILHLAMGSACELEYHLMLARDLAYMPLGEFASFQAEAIRVKRMLASLIATVSNAIERSSATQRR